MTITYRAAWEINDWANDIASFEMWKKLYIKYKHPYAMQRMVEIRNNWPNHQKQMPLPEIKD